MKKIDKTEEESVKGIDMEEIIENDEVFRLVQSGAVSAGLINQTAGIYALRSNQSCQAKMKMSLFKF